MALVDASPRTCATFFADIADVVVPSADNVNGLPGETLARRLAEALRAAGHEPREPFCEDWGWCVPFRVAGREHWLGVGARMTPEVLLGDDVAASMSLASEPTCLCFVERSWSLRTLFAGAGARQVTSDAALAVHEALVGLPDVSGLRWHRKARFDAGDESDGAATPA